MRGANDGFSYDDIVGLDRPISKKHRPMPRENRAAQFAPFAALTGFDAVIDEEARLTDCRIELDEARKEELDRALAELWQRICEQPKIQITHFVQDTRKTGGAYVTTRGIVKRMENRALVLQDGTRIEAEDVLSVRIV